MAQRDVIVSLTGYELVVVSLGCHIDQIWNPIKSKSLKNPIRDFLDQIIWSRKTHIKLGWHLLVETKTREDRRKLCFWPACLHSCWWVHLNCCGCWWSAAAEFLCGYSLLHYLLVPQEFSVKVNTSDSSEIFQVSYPGFAMLRKPSSWTKQLSYSWLLQRKIAIVGLYRQCHTTNLISPFSHIFILSVLYSKNTLATWTQR